MAKKEFKTGETFQLGLVKLKVEQAGSSVCEGYYLEGCDCYGQLRYLVGPCDVSREDRMNVIFVKVEE